MLSHLTAVEDLRGHRIDVSWAWSGLGERPAFRLLRRRRAYPTGPEDGEIVAEIAAIFRTGDLPWERVSQVRYLAAGSSAEGGLSQASITFFHSAAGSSDPARVHIEHYDAATEATLRDSIDQVSRVELTLPDPAPWGLVERLELFHTPGGGGETSAGVVTIRRDHSDGATASVLRWEPAGGAATEVEFDAGELRQIVPRIEAATPSELRGVSTSLRRLDGWDLATALTDPEATDPALLESVAVITMLEQFSEDTGDWTRQVIVSDLGPATEETSYYSLFLPDPADPASWTRERDWRTHATATARYGFPERMYGLLPSMHQYYDEPTVEDRNRGELRRFLQVFGVALDYLRSGIEGLGTRHDLVNARGDFLPALGEWIAWPTDRTAPLPVQRSEIRLAPRVYETVGTLPNITSLTSRATGWPCQAKEFVHNLFLTNAPEYRPVRELRTLTHDGTAFGPAAVLTSTSAFDGRPATALTGSGDRWLFWHSNRSSRWEIWALPPGADPTPVEELPPDRPAPRHADLAPTAIGVTGAGGDELWLFWESDREGAWDIWWRVHDGTAWGKALRITDHRSADRRPGVARGSAGEVWVFWESERRGPSEIWGRVHDGTAWGPAVRITEAAGLGRDHDPAGVVDGAGRLRLVWRRDESDRSRLYSRTFDSGVWGPEVALENGPWRDESPSLALRAGMLWLLWHSNRTGRWELWARVHDGTVWGDPIQVTSDPNPSKEPVVLADGTDLRVVWRYERPAPEYRSRTVDTTDTDLLARMGRYADRIHYTYDTARSDLDWYARDTVGLYVTPPAGTAREKVEEALDRARTYIDPFCPATVRLVLIPEDDLATGDLFVDEVDLENPIVDSFEDQID